MNDNLYTNKSIEKITRGDSNRVGFIKSLFDFRFEHFIYIRVASFFYALTLFLVLFGGAFIIIAAILSMAIGNMNAGTGIALIFATPIAALMLIILSRLGFESGIALVAIAENTRKN